jgi:hypothetical protein
LYDEFGIEIINNTLKRCFQCQFLYIADCLGFRFYKYPPVSFFAIVSNKFC